MTAVRWAHSAEFDSELRSREGTDRWWRWSPSCPPGRSERAGRGSRRHADAARTPAWRSWPRLGPMGVGKAAPLCASRFAPVPGPGRDHLPSPSSGFGAQSRLGWHPSAYDRQCRGGGPASSAQCRHAARGAADQMVPSARFDISGQGQPGYLRLPLLVSGTAVGAWQIDDARRRGIFPGYPRVLADLDGFGGRVRNLEERFSGARELAQGLHTLPTHSLLEEQDLAGLSAWLSSVGVRTTLPPSGSPAPWSKLS